jgi:hypothetical protein
LGGKTIKKGPGPWALVTAFLLGSIHGILGLHLIQEGLSGGPGIRRDRFFRHLIRLFLVGSLIVLAARSCEAILAWVPLASGHSILLSFLALPSLYLSLEVLWPGSIGRVLGTRRSFLCPQCYQRQEFRFQPVSFQFGSWVTYLCPYCSCLADAWGEQILYPSPLTVLKILKSSWRTVIPSLMALALGASFMVWLSGWV